MPQSEKDNLLNFIEGFINKISVNDLQKDAMMLMVTNQFNNLSDDAFQDLKKEALKIASKLDQKEVKPNVFS